MARTGPWPRSAFVFSALIQIIEDATVSAKAKLQDIRENNSSIGIADMFEMQMLMNQLAQFSEMSTGVVSAAHQAVMTMARNVKS